MKRVLSLVLALALVLGSIPAGFAADTKTAGEVLKGYGVLQGDESGNLNETQTIDRATMYTILIKLLGKDADAKAYTVPSTFSDDNTSWAANYIAFAEKEGLTKGVGNGLFSPNGKVTLQQMATIMLRALGYEANYNTAIADATAKGLLKSVVEDQNNGLVLKSDVYTSMLNTLSAPVKDSTELLGNVLKIKDFTTVVAGPMAVSTITANTAKSFQVTFASPVDTTKVSFDVKRETTKATVTVTWNEAKTVATLTAASKLAEGKYTVTANNITTADKPVVLKTQELTIEKEKVTKVELTNKSITRISDTQGYVGFKVMNQYNEDITDSALGRGLVWTSSTSATSPTIDYKSKLVTVTHNASTTNTLANLTTVVVTARDTTTGFVHSANLEVSKTVGAVNSVKIEGIINEKGETVDFVYGTGKTYYLDFTVTDVNGQEVKDYDVLTASNNGLAVLTLTATNNTNITMTADRDPLNSSNLAYRINLGTAPTFDTPITFIANAPYSGVNSTFSATLKKAAALQTFKLYSPSETVSVNKAVEIPFEAFDQNGNAITKFADINTYVTFSDSTAELVKQADGTAKLFITYTTTGTRYLTATVPGSTTGSFSQVSLDVKDTALPAKLAALTVSRAVTSGSSVYVGRISSFDIRDQFDTKMNLRTAPTATYGNYKLAVTSSNTAVASPSAVSISGDGKLYVDGGNTAGSATLTYRLFVDTNANGVVDTTETVVDTATTVVYNIGLNDVTDIKIDAATTDSILNVTSDGFYATSGGATTKAGDTMYADLDIYGISKTGMEVELPSANISSVTSSNSLFTVNSDNTVVAKTAYASGVHAATTNITALVSTPNGVYEKSVALKSSDEKAVVSAVSVATVNSDLRAGNVAVNNNVYTIKASFLNGLAAKSLFQYNAAGADNTPGNFYFKANTQYATPDGTGVATCDRVVVVKNSGTGSFTANSTTGVVSGTAVVGDVYTITVLAGSKTLTIVVKVIL